MRLAEALLIGARRDGTNQRRLHLLCGFEPLHLTTFVRAYLRQRFPEDVSQVTTGLYGDLEGNLQRAAESDPFDGAVVVAEWSDFDGRLGFRNAAVWKAALLDDILTQVRGMAEGLLPVLAQLGRKTPVVLAAPTLPLPRITHFSPVQASPFELHLSAELTRFLERAAAMPGVRVLNGQSLSFESPAPGRHDLKMELQTGFPYTLFHADVLAQMAITALFPPAPKKGLITDLDNTLWKGILGDDGVDGVAWSLESKAHIHTIYQQFLSSLSDAGVLLAIASKNDASLVNAALERSDLLLRPSQIFPVEVSWEPKSNAVSRILKAWNIASDSIVFVDDNPMELAEVAEKHPGITCLEFTPHDPANVAKLLHMLRVLLGKPTIREEDRLRLSSLRASTELAGAQGETTSSDFIGRLAAHFDIAESSPDDQRVFELVNKTNQFNLNGRRYTESDWRTLHTQSDRFLLSVNYEDRFGPLGRIAVVGGRRTSATEALIDIWVMSCRAFSRQIEFQTLRQAFERTGAQALSLDFTPTKRNGPFQSMLRVFFPDELNGSGALRLQLSSFTAVCPTLTHEVKAPWTLSAKD